MEARWHALPGQRQSPDHQRDGERADAAGHQDPFALGEGPDRALQVLEGLGVHDEIEASVREGQGVKIHVRVTHQAVTRGAGEKRGERAGLVDLEDSQQRSRTGHQISQRPRALEHAHHGMRERHRTEVRLAARAPQALAAVDDLRLLRGETPLRDQLGPEDWLPGAPGSSAAGAASRGSLPGSLRPGDLGASCHRDALITTASHRLDSSPSERDQLPSEPRIGAVETKEEAKARHRKPLDAATATGQGSRIRPR